MKVIVSKISHQNFSFLQIAFRLNMDIFAEWGLLQSPLRYTGYILFVTKLGAFSSQTETIRRNLSFHWRKNSGKRRKLLYQMQVMDALITITYMIKTSPTLMECAWLVCAAVRTVHSRYRHIRAVRHIGVRSPPKVGCSQVRRQFRLVQRRISCELCAERRSVCLS